MDDARFRGAAEIIAKLNEHGFAAYMVGGFVRDHLLGRATKDIDIATAAVPDEVMRLFARTAATGLQHGTVTVIYGGCAYEVTTFRKESAYKDHRRPERVAFISDLREDLRRRDFTINAMAMDGQGRVIDPFGGADDLAARILRCVGEADARFAEDALRMLRGIRFAAEYRLEIDRATWSALLRNREQLRHIAMERVRMELERIVEGADPRRGLELLADSGVLQFVKAESVRSLDPPALKESGRLLALAPAPGTAAQRWALFFTGGGLSVEAAGTCMKQLTFPRKKLTAVASLLSFREWLAAACEEAGFPVSGERLKGIWKRGFIEYSGAVLKEWLGMTAAVAEHRRPPLSDRMRRCCKALLGQGERWLAEIPVASPRALAITGRELLALERQAPRAGQRPEGPWVGRVLEQLYADVVFGCMVNEQARLLEGARDYMREWYGDE